jgi:predicted nucleotidyltransferase
MVNIANPKPYSPSDAKIDEMVARIVREFDPLKIILFGSCARGDATAESHVDLLVVLDRVADKRMDAVRIGTVLADLLVAKDVIVSTPDEIARRGHRINTALNWALTEGVTLYDRT